MDSSKWKAHLLEGGNAVVLEKRSGDYQNEAWTYRSTDGYHLALLFVR